MRRRHNTSYDGIGRVKKRYVTVNAAAPTYATASVVINDTVMRQEEFTYDAASNVIQQTTRERFHNAAGTGELQTPSTEPKARVSYVALYPDALGREQASADYGTNAAATLSRPATLPARSDTVLVNSTAYNTAGEAWQTTDPKGVITETTFDHAGRLTQKVEDVGGLARESQCAYNADGRLKTLTAKNAITGDQLTKYFYGVTSPESGLASNDLLRAVIYPDSPDTDPSGSDQVKFAYNGLGEVIKKTLPKHTGEATATVHVYEYDKVGRLLHDRATAFGAGIDQTVKRIARNYEIRGMLEKISSYDHATPGSGTIVNEVQFAYNDFSLLTADYQSHSGAVVINSTPKVQYAYADGSANHTRVTSLTYPDSRVTTLDYGTTDGADDLLCRVASLKQGTTVLAGYGYLGVNLPIRVNYSDQPGVELTCLKQGDESNGDAGDQYRGLDRFGRLVDQRWLKTSDSTNREREWVQYGFDRASNRVWRANRVGTSNQDEHYTYDNLYQLKTLKRGNLNAGKTDISGTPVWQEDWNYDPTSNWRGTTSAYVTKVNGTTTLNQNRTHDKANELLTITGTPDWFDPTASGYDGAGNMIKVPQPAAPTTGYDCKYDAWDRLVEVKVTDGAVVATYRYDGLKRRVTKVAGGNTRHYYYSNRWQVLEERLNALSTADRKFVWGIRHVDDLVERDRGSERFYVLHDHLSVTAIINTTGAVQERYGYDGFGPRRVLDASFGARAASLYDWETGFGAYRLDTETGLYQVRNRAFHPKLGRWTGRDPLGMLGQASSPGVSFPLNSYCYVGNRATNTHDASGLKPVTTKVAKNTVPLIIPIDSHVFLSIGGTTCGYWPVGGWRALAMLLPFMWVPGIVESPDLATGHPRRKSTPIVLDDCMYDIWKFEYCVRHECYRHKLGCYNLLFHNCWHWVWWVLDMCERYARIR